MKYTEISTKISKISAQFLHRRSLDSSASLHRKSRTCTDLSFPLQYKEFASISRRDRGSLLDEFFPIAWTVHVEPVPRCIHAYWQIYVRRPGSWRAHTSIRGRLGRVKSAVLGFRDRFVQSDDIVVKANIVGQISLPRQLLPQPACCGGPRLLFERTVGIPYNICPIHSSYPSDNCQILSGISWSDDEWIEIRSTPFFDCPGISFFFFSPS